MGLGAESVHWPAGSSVLLTTAVGLTTGISAKHTRNTVISLVKCTFLPFKYGLNDLALWLLTVQSSQRTNACLNLIKLIPETFMITWIHPQQNPKFRRIMRRKKKKSQNTRLVALWVWIVTYVNNAHKNTQGIYSQTCWINTDRDTYWWWKERRAQTNHEFHRPKWWFRQHFKEDVERSCDCVSQGMKCMSDDPILAFSTWSNPLGEDRVHARYLWVRSVCVRFALSSKNRCWVDMAA